MSGARTRGGARVTALVALVALAPALFLATSAPAQPVPEGRPGNPYDRQYRVAVIDQLLDALRASDARLLEDIASYIQVTARNSCRSTSVSLTTSCLIEAARRNCDERGGDGTAGARCHLVSDLIVTNRLSENDFIDNRARYKLMEKNSDVEGAIRRELRGRYASLVAEFRISPHFAGDQLPPGIDAFCLERAGARGTSWQHCVAAIIWFIGTSPT